jgi:hypothetical protein
MHFGTLPQVAAHARDALRMQKPLLVNDLGMPYGNPAHHLALQTLVMGYLANATKQGMPTAGKHSCAGGCTRGGALTSIGSSLPVLEWANQLNVSVHAQFQVHL